MAIESIPLKHWYFQTGSDFGCLANARKITVPHTWNIEPGNEEYTGPSWYEYRLSAPDEWRNKRVTVRFKAVYHNAEIYLNGKLIGTHCRSGYTPFSVELTPYLSFTGDNILAVKADNCFSSDMLPYQHSYDWANDGGIIRDAVLLLTGPARITHTKITAAPIILSNNSRQDSGAAVWGTEMTIDNTSANQLHVDWALYKQTKKGNVLICEETHLVNGQHTTLENRCMEHIDYWHFDHPQLYLVKAVLYDGSEISDIQETRIGFREFVIKGSSFFLNGEPVRLCGTEWMPGSSTVYGMAEPQEQLEKMLTCLKESNSIYTRFHWQQDDLLLDWCDTHGLLVQEEIPFWGPTPAAINESQWDIARYQADEMIRAHRNHPSIIAWGIGNELNAQNEDTINYIKNIVSYTRQLDSTRPVNYVSNTFYDNPACDGTCYGDTIMINDYIGTWHGEKDELTELNRVINSNPGKPVVPAEFGLCEPAFDGGDERRASIFLEKLNTYRKLPAIAGAIYFSLNDYRTHMGETGTGKWKQRIHGSTDLDGVPKPSYYIVQKEYSPVDIIWKDEQLLFTCKSTLPCYLVKDYYVRLLDDEGTCIKTIPLPTLLPGTSWSTTVRNAHQIVLYRPNGDCAGSVTAIFLHKRHNQSNKTQSKWKRDF